MDGDHGVTFNHKELPSDVDLEHFMGGKSANGGVYASHHHVHGNHANGI